ncbi:hypothetical protein BT96DRAFT_975721 [Gymnopus androsaceus JB14]|uniref:Uncharacterized protein n=1 Tax=Gymnopus androsaceus JB14 TaxID=1447944 RepID=A0A6A4HP22_9AGAR|nr:hypothetical protein BT96DRAFT_975721 [Gymnopus androsaceus JB14]
MGDSTVELWKTKQLLQKEVNKLKRKQAIPLSYLLLADSSFPLVSLPLIFKEMHAQLMLLMDQYDITLPQLPDFDFSRLETEWNRGLESWSTSPEYRPFFREKLLEASTLPTPRYVRQRVSMPASTFIQGYWIWSKIVENLAVLKSTIEGFKETTKEKDVVAARIRWVATVFLVQINPSLLNAHSLIPVERYSWLLLRTQSKWVEIPGTRRRRDLIGLRTISKRTSRLVGHIWPKIAEFFVSFPLQGVAKAMSAFLSGEMRIRILWYGAFVLGGSNQAVTQSGATLLLHPTTLLIVDIDEETTDDVDHEREEDLERTLHANNITNPNDNTTTTTKRRRQQRVSHTHGEFIAFRQTPVTVHVSIPGADGGKEDVELKLAENEGEDSTGEKVGNMTAETAGQWILEHTPVDFSAADEVYFLQKMMDTNYSFGIERDEEALKRNNLDHRKWTNPLEVQLPNAPSMKMFCVYGHGKETERSYWYAHGDYEHDESAADGVTPRCTDPDPSSNQTGPCSGITPRTPLDMPLLRKSWIDADYTDESGTPQIRNGVKLGEGDGTVSLLSLGAMCVEGWKRPRWNPAGINITVVELPHRPVPSMPRGGANTSEHVDVLGSTPLNEIILKVATGVGHEVEENFVSNIKTYAARMGWD